MLARSTSCLEGETITGLNHSSSRGAGHDVVAHGESWGDGGVPPCVFGERVV